MKILFLDTENSPNVSYTWGKYEQDVIDFKKEWFMMSFAYRWMGEKKTKVKCLPDYGTFDNDFGLISDLWDLLDEADVVVGHNIDRFDVRKINARLLFHGFKPPKPFKTVDTLKLARKHFMLNSNKLNDLAKYLNVGNKIDTGGFSLWLQCMSGDTAAWKKMCEYNRKDVDLLIGVYEELKIWHPTHPNINILNENLDENCQHCPTCGSSNLQRRGTYVTKLSKAQRYQCQDCGAWSRGTLSRVSEIKIV